MSKLLVNIEKFYGLAIQLKTESYDHFSACVQLMLKIMQNGSFLYYLKRIVEIVYHDRK